VVEYIEIHFFNSGTPSLFGGNPRFTVAPGPAPVREES
jgi:hypothetical protein